jgi:ADP-ribose pyrophosphatase
MLRPYNVMMFLMAEILFQDGQYKVVREEVTLLDGRVKEFTVIHRHDAVHILAFKDDETILLLREYRPFYREWVWMLPSGLVDKEHDIKTAAVRELREETGYTGNVQLWFSANQTESFARTNYVFLARNLTYAPLAGDDDECIEVHEVSLNDAIKNVQKDHYRRHMLTGYALLRYGAERGIV